MRYLWYKEDFPRDLFLGQWNEYDLWFDPEDETYVAVFGGDDHECTSIDKMNWEYRNEYVMNSEHREALGKAKAMWETPDPSVSPGCQRRSG